MTSSTPSLKARKKVTAIKDILHFVPQKGAQEHGHIVFLQGNIEQVNWRLSETERKSHISLQTALQIQLRRWQTRDKIAAMLLLAMKKWCSFVDKLHPWFTAFIFGKKSVDFIPVLTVAMNSLELLFANTHTDCIALHFTYSETTCSPWGTRVPLGTWITRISPLSRSTRITLQNNNNKC